MKIQVRNNNVDKAMRVLKNKLQEEVTNILLKKGTSISKVLNTQAFSIRDLKRNFIIDNNIRRNQLN